MFETSFLGFLGPRLSMARHPHFFFFFWYFRDVGPNVQPNQLYNFSVFKSILTSPKFIQYGPTVPFITITPDIRYFEALSAS